MKRDWALVIALVGAIGCGDDDGTTPPVDGGTDPDTGVEVDADTPDAPGTDAVVEDPRVVACRATLAARATEVAAMLPWPADDATEMVREGGDQALEADYAGRYRDDLATHPGCVPRASSTRRTRWRC